MVSWSFALVFSDLSALRQVNAQHIQFLCEITARNQPYLVSQHVNGKSRDKAPSLVVTPLIDLHGSREWFDKGRKLLWRDADLLWAAASGDPLCRHSTLRRCPLTDGEIQKAFQLVLTQACGMAAHEAQQYTKHSARKLLVSVAQSAGCPWEQAIELGRWAGTSLDKACVMSAEDARRKHALEIMNMPKRYSANARLMRVARICGNQVQRMSSYLRGAALLVSTRTRRHTGAPPSATIHSPGAPEKSVLN